MTADLAPPVERRHGQGRRPTHHQPQSGGTGRPGVAGLVVGLLPRRGEPGVDGRNGHEQRDLAGREALPHVGGVESTGRLTDRPGGERAQRHVDQTVDVVEREDEHDPVVGGPLPGGQHPVDHRRDAAVGVHGALRASGRAARVDHHRGVVEPRFTAPRRPASGDVDHRRTRAGGHALGDVSVLLGRDDHPRATVVDDVRQLGVRVLGVQRDGDRAGVPAGEEGGHEVVAGSADDRDPVTGASVTGQDCGEPGGIGVDGLIRPRPGRVDDRHPVPVHPDALDHRPAAHATTVR